MLIIDDPMFGAELVAPESEYDLLRKMYMAMRTDYSEDYISPNMVFPSEQSMLTAIVDNCLKHGHWGIAEHSMLTFATKGFPHSVMQQMRTHRHASFDVQCIAEDQEVQLCDSTGTRSLGTRTIGYLADTWLNGEQAIRTRKIRGRKGEPPGEYRRSAKNRLSKLHIRVLNEHTGKFQAAKLVDAFYKGKLPVYKVSTQNGKSITCTLNHRLFTDKGWLTLADCNIGTPLATNGSMKRSIAVWQDKSFLLEKLAEGKTRQEIADLCSCSFSTVKKWASIHKISFKQNEPKKKPKPIVLSEEQKQRRSEHARRNCEKYFGLKGEKHPSFKPDLPEAKRARNLFKYFIADKQKPANCQRCGECSSLHWHHIVPINENASLACEMSNLIAVCPKCHVELEPARKAKTNTWLEPDFSPIVSIEYVGEKPCYDISVSGEHKGFVCNKIVTHNSGRYSGKRIVDAAYGKRDLTEVFYVRPEGFYPDRHGKADKGKMFDADTRQACLQFAKASAVHYAMLHEQGYSPETCRLVLATEVRQNFMLSVSLRSFLHLVKIRYAADVQPECQTLMHHLLQACIKQYPLFFGWYTTDKGIKRLRLAP